MCLRSVVRCSAFWSRLVWVVLLRNRRMREEVLFLEVKRQKVFLHLGDEGLICMLIPERMQIRNCTARTTSLCSASLAGWPLD